MKSTRLYPQSLALFQELINYLKDADSNTESNGLIDECIGILSSYSGPSLDQLWAQMINLFLHLRLPLTKLLDACIKMIPHCINTSQRQQLGEISKHIFEYFK